MLKAFEAALTSKTKLLSFCHINYTDGCLMPVKEICELARSKGIVTLVDGAQPPGMLQLDLHDLGCDLYAGPCHKWMLASMYTGFFYVREDFIDRIWPIMYTGPVHGKTMYGEETPEDRAYTVENHTGAAKFDRRGSANYPACVSVDAALDFHTHLTSEAVEARDRALAHRLSTGLRALDGVDVYVSDDPCLACGLVSFRVNNVPTVRVNADLWLNHNIYIRNVVHPEINWDVNRASLHLMVTAQQVDLLIGAIEEIAQTAGRRS